MTGPRTVSGQVRLNEPLATGGTLHVRIEDVSRADAASTIVAETSIAIDHPIAAGGSIPFSVVVPEVDERASYSVRVHLDTTGSHDITPGDRISTAAYPVLTHSYPDVVTVEAQTI